MSVSSAEVLRFAPVPTSGPLMGPLAVGTRITFRNNQHQDVTELQQDVADRLNRAA
ncbi:MAG TPA: hypothetical protein VMS43_06435 [Allosphingosinicella sp.]|nr:hypothetical protein [Allosphingosinicella sp.]